jgi:hypothetical protein
MAKRYFSPLTNIDFNTYGGRFKKGVVNGGMQQTTKGSTFSIYADDIILSTDYSGSYDSLSPGNINLIPTGAVFLSNSVNPPTDTPSNGGYLYVNNGVLFYKDTTGVNLQLSSPCEISNITSAQISPTAGILGSQLSATAGITGAQLSATAGIVGTQLSGTAGITGSQLSGTAGITGAQLSATANIAGSQLSGTAGITGAQLSSTAGIVGTQLSATANIAGSQLSATAGITGAQLSATAGITGAQLSATANIAGSQLSATAGITGAQLSGTAGITGAQLSGTAGITGAQLSATAGIVGTQLSATANIAGSQLSATAGITGAQLSATAGITGSQLSATANITGAQLSATANIAGTQLSATAGITGSQLSATAGITGTQLSATAGITATQLSAAIQAQLTSLSVPRWIDLLGEITQGTSSAALTYEAYRDTSHQMFFFRSDQTDQLYMRFQMPHGFVIGSQVRPHVHVLPMSTIVPTQNVRMTMAYAWGDGYAIPANTGWTSADFDLNITSAMQYKAQILSGPLITATSSVIGSSFLLCTWTNKVGDGAYTYKTDKTGGTGKANLGVLMADCHVQISTLGSINELPS